MKILVGKLKDLWPELTVPMSIPKKIDESKEKLIGNLKPHRSIENAPGGIEGGGGSSRIVADGNQQHHHHQQQQNNHKDSGDDNDGSEGEDDDEGICLIYLLVLYSFEKKALVYIVYIYVKYVFNSRFQYLMHYLYYIRKITFFTLCRKSME